MIKFVALLFVEKRYTYVFKILRMGYNGFHVARFRMRYSNMTHVMMSDDNFRFEIFQHYMVSNTSASKQ